MTMRAFGFSLALPGLLVVSATASSLEGGSESGGPNPSGHFRSGPVAGVSDVANERPADQRSGIAVALRSELRTRSDLSGPDTAQGEGSEPESEVTLQLDPLLLGILAKRDLRFTASYSPRLLITPSLSSVESSSFELLHQGELSAQWVASATSRVNARARMSYGKRDFSLTAQATGSPDVAPQLQPLPEQEIVLSSFSIEPLLGIDWRARERLALSGGLSYLASGGTGDSRRVLPLQQGPVFRGKIAFDVTRRDVLSLQASGSRTTTSFTSDPWSGGSSADSSSEKRATVASALGSWQRQISRTTQGYFGLGASGVQNEGTGNEGSKEPSDSVFPAAQAGLTHRVPLKQGQIDQRVEARVGPFVDPIAGSAYQRVEGSLSVGWIATQKLRLATLGALAWAPSRENQAMVFLQLGAAYSLSDFFQLDGGVRASWQRVPQSSSSDFSEWGAFVAITFTSLKGA
jgi:hypothetical protein